MTEKGVPCADTGVTALCQDQKVPRSSSVTMNRAIMASAVRIISAHTRIKSNPSKRLTLDHFLKCIEHSRAQCPHTQAKAKSNHLYPHSNPPPPLPPAITIHLPPLSSPPSTSPRHHHLHNHTPLQTPLYPPPAFFPSLTAQTADNPNPTLSPH